MMYDAAVVRCFRTQILNLPFGLNLEKVAVESDSTGIRIDTIQGADGRHFAINGRLDYDPTYDQHLINVCVYSIGGDVTPVITATRFFGRDDIRLQIKASLSETVTSLLHESGSFFRQRYFGSEFPR